MMNYAKYKEIDDKYYRDTFEMIKKFEDDIERKDDENLKLFDEKS